MTRKDYACRMESISAIRWFISSDRVFNILVESGLSTNEILASAQHIIDNRLLWGELTLERAICDVAYNIKFGFCDRLCIPIGHRLHRRKRRAIRRTA